MKSLLPIFLFLLLVTPDGWAQKLNTQVTRGAAAEELSEPLSLPAYQPFDLKETHPSRNTGVMSIEFEVKVAGHYVISAVGAHGRKIETIANQYYEEGHHRITWMVIPGAHGIYMNYTHHDGLDYFHRLLIIKY